MKHSFLSLSALKFVSEPTHPRTSYREYLRHALALALNLQHMPFSINTYIWVDLAPRVK
jgi:hypothetical protein